MNKTLLSCCAMPILLLLAAAASLPFSETAPPFQQQLVAQSPFIVLDLAVLLALWFNQGRVALILLVLIAVQWGVHAGLLNDSRPFMLATALFLPLDIIIYSCLPERGLAGLHGGLRLSLLAVEAALAGWAFHFGPPPLRAFLADAWVIAPIAPDHALSWLGLLALLAGFVTLLACTLWRPNPLHAGCLGTVLAAAIALDRSQSPVVSGTFLSAAGCMLAFAVLLASRRMAYRDELTGLASRRALNEHLLRLSGTYAIAMVDVDHFKQFNTEHGHDAGDQVLRMVAAHIDRAGGGSRAYRYGGEEFTLVFPRRDAAEAMTYLEALCAEIADYEFDVRSAAPRQTGRRGQGGGCPVRVTISIGVAERNEQLRTPDEVLQAADQALYRAKDKGRNQVSQ